VSVSTTTEERLSRTTRIGAEFRRVEERRGRGREKESTRVDRKRPRAKGNGTEKKIFKNQKKK
jgi:hypothetical protein